jgi:uncharacterized membrane protein
MNLGLVFLILHVGGAIVAFGPTFAFPLIGSMGGKEPMHANFATRVSEAISDRIVIPLGLFQAVTGAGLIITRGWDLFATPWLLLAIVLYVIAISTSIFYQRPTVNRVIAMTSAPPPGAGGPPPGAGGPPPGAGGPPPGAGGPPPGAAGPPPELLALIKRIQRTGMVLSVLLVSIIVLMVWKPAF